MREYLFKANRIDNGEEVIGSLLQGIAHDKECAIIVPKSELFSMIGTSFCDECNRHYDIDYEVIPETVRQFTGLTDKNGTLVFEGDILSIETDIGQCVKDIWKNVTQRKVEPFGTHYIRQDEAIVRFNQYRCEFDLKVYNNGKYKRIAKFNKSSLNYYNAEIIGNIHDNKELLEAEE